MNGARPSEASTARINYAALGERVARLVDDVQGLRKELGDIRGSMPSAAAVRDIASKLDSFGQRIEERNKTQWPTLISAGGLILTIMLAIGALVYRPVDAMLDRHEKMLTHFESRYIDDLKQQVDRLGRR